MSRRKGTAADDAARGLISVAELKRRGWTESLIAKSLGEPDETRINPNGRKGLPSFESIASGPGKVKLFAIARVKAVEKQPAFLERLAKHAASKADDAADMDLDANMRALVHSLNRLPGITTFSSCGGHFPARNPSQRNEGEFFVSFYVDVLAGGWRSLEKIAGCMSSHVDGPKLTLTVSMYERLTFELEGNDGASPDTLAQLIEEDQ